MKNLLLFTIFLCVGQSTIGQTLKPFEDAINIMESIESGKDDDFVDILKKYSDNHLNMISSNAFLNKSDALNGAITHLATEIAAGRISTDATINSTQSTNGSFSFIPQNEAIDALGTFIADRFKQELNIAFLNKFKDKLKGQPELQLLMPTTYQFLLVNEPYNYTAFLESLRSALKKDLKNLPANLPGLIEAQQSQIVPATMSLNDFIALLIGLEGVKSYLEGGSSAKILLDMTGHSRVSSLTNQNLKTSLEFANTITSELYDDLTNNWYSSAEMTAIFTDPDARLIFLGLLYEKYKASYLPLLLNANFPNYMDRYYKLSQHLEEYKKKIKGIQISGNQPTSNEVIKYLELTIQILEATSDLSTIGIPQPAIIKDKIIPYAKKSMSIAQNIQAKDYATGFVNTLSIIGQTLPNSNFKTDFIKYGNFAVGIVTAENSQEMVKALEASALPVGSYKIKRNSFSNISLNAYAGAFVGKEYFNESKMDLPVGSDIDSKATIFGFTAPVGIAFSTGGRRKLITDEELVTLHTEIAQLQTLGSPTSKQKKELTEKVKVYTQQSKLKSTLRAFKNKDNNKKFLGGGSWSIFVSILDVGAVTSLRLTSDDVEALPDVTFKNFLAPGLHLVRGFRNVPLSWSFGAQYGPQIRKTSDLNADAELLISSWSLRTSLVVDIPIFNFFTKAEK